jgi:hypothetical protein
MVNFCSHWASIKSTILSGDHFSLVRRNLTARTVEPQKRVSFRGRRPGGQTPRGSGHSPSSIVCRCILHEVGSYLESSIHALSTG